MAILMIPSALFLVTLSQFDFSGTATPKPSAEDLSPASLYVKVEPESTDRDIRLLFIVRNNEFTPMLINLNKFGPSAAKVTFRDAKRRVILSNNDRLICCYFPGPDTARPPKPRWSAMDSFRAAAFWDSFSFPDPVRVATIQATLSFDYESPDGTTQHLELRAKQIDNPLLTKTKVTPASRRSP